MTVTKKWFAICVETGKEQTVAKDIRKQTRIQDLEDKITKVLVPTKKLEVVRNTKKGTVRGFANEKQFPGYVLVQCASELRTYTTPKAKAPVEVVSMDVDVWNVLTEVRNVMYLLPTNDDPRPLADTEADAVLALVKRNEEAAPTKKVQIKYHVGDLCEVKGTGPWVGSTVRVKEIDSSDPTDPKVKVEVKVFGRPVDVILKHFELEVA
jgi:transcriptional antiterminator NusG